MTCIVGVIESDGTVVIGGDSAGVDSRYSLQIRRDPKVFRRGPFLVGFTTSFRMGQLLAFNLNAPRRFLDKDVYEFMVTDFVGAVRQCLKDGGFAEKKNERESGGEFLVGYAGRLFTICDDYQVAECLVDYAACGCGDLIALGALHATAHAIAAMPGEDRVRGALSAAQALSAGVREPFTVLSLDPTEGSK